MRNKMDYTCVHGIEQRMGRVIRADHEIFVVETIPKEEVNASPPENNCLSPDESSSE